MSAIQCQTGQFYSLDVCLLDVPFVQTGKSHRNTLPAEDHGAFDFCLSAHVKCPGLRKFLPEIADNPGIYTGTKSAIADLADGDKIAIPNDGSNRARGLLLLEQEGIITLKEGVGMEATVLDIASYSVNVEIVEMEAAQIAGVRDSVALAVINGNYALQAGLNAGIDALAVEDAASISATTYANILVVKEGNEESEKTLALKKALLSQEVKDYINDTYSGAVVPIF